MAIFGWRGPISAVIWLVLVLAIALFGLRNRRVWFPGSPWRLFQAATLLLFGLSLAVAVPTSAVYTPVVLNVRWMWFPLLFPAGVLAVFAFGPMPALLLTLATAILAVVLHRQPYTLPASAVTLVLAWVTLSLILRRYNTRWMYFGASLLTAVLTAPIMLLLEHLLWGLDLGVDWSWFLDVGRILLFVQTPYRMADILLAGLVTEVLHTHWWARRNPRYGVLLWRPLWRVEPSMQVLFLVFAIPGGLVLLYVFSVFNLLMVGQRVRTLLSGQIRTVGQFAGFQTAFALEYGQRTLQAWSQEQDWATLTPEERQQRLQSLVDHSFFFHSLLLTDLQGRILAQARKVGIPAMEDLSPQEQGMLTLFQKAPSLTFLETSVTPPFQNSFVSFAVRLPKQPEWVLIGRTWLSINPYMEPVLQELGYLQETIQGRGFLLDAQGQPLVLQNRDIGFSDVVKREILPQLGPLSQRQARFIRFSTGEMVLAFLEPLSGYSWSLLAFVPLSHLHRLSGEMSQGLLIWGGGLLVLVLSFAMTVLSYVTRSLRELAREAHRIAQGDLDHALPPGGLAEVRLLRTSFEQMRLSLRQRLGELQQLLDVGRKLVASLDWEAVVQPVLEAALVVPEAQVARVVLDPAFVHQATSLAFGYGNGHENFEPLDAVLLQNPALEEFQLLPLTQIWPAFQPLPWPTTQAHQAHVLILFLWNDADLVGVMHIVFRTLPERWETLLRYYRTLAEQLRLALASARLYRQAVTQRQRLAAVLNATPDAIFMTDMVYNVVLANPSAKKLLEWPEEDSAYPLSLEQAFTHPELLDMMLNASRTPASREIELGEGQVYFATVAPVEVEGRVVGFAGILRDITHFKEAERAKAEFVASISHDLRSPLTVIRGYTSMLEIVGRLNDRQRHYVSQILAALENISSLVDNLLELSRLDMGMTIRPEWLPLKEMVHQVVHAFDVRAQQKHIQLDIRYHPDAPGMIEADSGLFQRALQNLVDNAIKFTPEGGRVTVRVEPRNEDRVLLVVEDTGIGIAPEDRERLFDRFFQAERVRKMRLGGKGLGLAIVKSMVDLHHGRIWVESEPGKGARFFVELPIRQPKEGGASPKTPKPERNAT